MPLDSRNTRNELLDEFESTIQQRTHGRLTHLFLEDVDGAIVVEANTTTYYVVQLALAAIQTFVADIPQMAPAKLSFCVNGNPLVLHDHHEQADDEWAPADGESFDQQFASSMQLG